MSDTFWQGEQPTPQTAQDTFWASSSTQNNDAFWEDETQHQMAPHANEDDAFWSEENEEPSALDLIDEAIELLGDSTDHKDLVLMNALTTIVDLYQS